MSPTGIEWTDETWNVITGCTKVSPGCDHCYAERITNRFQGPGAFDEIVEHRERLEKPLRWRRRRLVFVNSMSDLFHNDVSTDMIARIFAVMGLAGDPEYGGHVFQVLTKRPGRMRSLLKSDAFAGLWWEHRNEIARRHKGGGLITWPLPNVWLGVSVEDQRWASVRIPLLRATPAAVRFLSCEPLLGPIMLEDPVDWVIVGGESGPGARPMHPEWARSLRDQCIDNQIPFFFKQWGAYVPAARNAVGSSGRDVAGLATHRGVRLDASTVALRVGKRSAGRALDGRTWDEMPQAFASLNAAGPQRSLVESSPTA